MMTRTVILLSRILITLFGFLLWTPVFADALPDGLLTQSISYEKTIEWRDDVPLFMSQASQTQHKSIEVRYVSGFQHYQVFDHPEQASVSFLSEQWTQHFVGLGYQQGFNCTHSDCPTSAEWQQQFAPRTLGTETPQAFLLFAKRDKTNDGPQATFVHIYLAEIGCCVRSTWRIVTTEQRNVDGLFESENPIQEGGNDRDMGESVFDVYFESNSAQLSTSQAALLTAQLASLTVDTEKPWMVQIQGHTDDTGTKSYNMDLSRLRAEQVVSALLSNGVSEQNIQVQYFGATQPVASNHTQDGRRLNRRVHIFTRELENDNKRP